MGRTDDVYSKVDVTIHQITPKAIRISIEDTDSDVWVPRSLIFGGAEIRLDDLDLPHEYPQMRIFKWFCKKNGLI
jgi:hypothetical protein